MADPKSAAVVVTLPEEIDELNADNVYLELCSAMMFGINVVVADFWMTTFCDSWGAHAMLYARGYAAHTGVQIRFVIPAGNVLRALALSSSCCHTRRLLRPWLRRADARTRGHRAGAASAATFGLGLRAR
jgi:hypothetical protein